MAYVLVRISVEDVATWMPVFEQATAIRKNSGSKGVQALTNVDSPNEVLIFGEYEDVEKARQMFQSQELRDAMQRAGVKGPPQLTFMNEILRLPA